MKFIPSILRSSLALLFLCGVLATALMSCDKESNTDALRRKYPIPTELPEATCEGLNTVGAHFDSILFVANYFPNTSSWGSPTPENGVRAYFDFLDDDTPYIRVLATHPIRPEEIDPRRMNSTIWYFPIEDSIGLASFLYVGNGIEFSTKKVGLPKQFSSGIFFDPIDSVLCGTIPELTLIETSSIDIGDPVIYDTIIMRDFRIDVPVHLGRY